MVAAGGGQRGACGPVRAAALHAVLAGVLFPSGLHGQSGEPEQLMKHYGLDTPNIVEAAKRVIKRFF